MNVSDVVLLGVATLAVMVGVVLQRITGSGVGALSAPPLILLLGPVAGVQVVHIVAALCSFVLLLTSWRLVHWRRALALTLTAVAATPLGVVLAFSLPEPALLIALGLVMLAAVFGVEAIARSGLMRSRRLGIIATGTFAGIANGAVGQAGPIMSAYAVAAKWALPNFVASMQVCWFVVNVVAIVVKGIPPVPPLLAPALLGAFVIGYLIGFPIGRAVTREAAIRWLLVAAVAGSLVVFAKGIVGLLGSEIG